MFGAPQSRMPRSSPAASIASVTSSSRSVRPAYGWTFSQPASVQSVGTRCRSPGWACEMYHSARLQTMPTLWRGILNTTPAMRTAILVRPGRIQNISGSPVVGHILHLPSRQRDRLRDAGLTVDLVVQRVDRVPDADLAREGRHLLLAQPGESEAGGYDRDDGQDGLPDVEPDAAPVDWTIGRPVRHDAADEREQQRDPSAAPQ
jgi:hypothetical protein